MLITTSRQQKISLQRNEPRGVGGTNTRSSVLNWLVRDGELSQIMSNHFRLYLNLVESLAIVNSNNASDHLRYDNHVTEVSLHKLWLLTCWGLTFLMARKQTITKSLFDAFNI